MMTSRQWLKILVAAALMLTGAATMLAAAWPGVTLSCDLMADPNYPHALFGTHLARGGDFVNTLYPGVPHFLTYALFIRIFGSIRGPFTFDDFENSVLLCRIASLSLNISLYWAACGCLIWLTRQLAPRETNGFSLMLLASFTVSWVVAFPINYYSYYLRPDNGLLLGLLACVVASVLIWRDIHAGGFRPTIVSGIWLGAGTVLLTISKNQGQPFLLAAVLAGAAAAVRFRQPRAFGLWCLVGVVSHLVIATGIWLFVAQVTRSKDLPWTVFADPTFAMRHSSQLALLNSSKFVRAAAWSLACSASAIAVICGFWNCRLLRMWRRDQRTWDAVFEIVALGLGVSFVLMLPLFYGLRLLAVYNLVIPVGAAIVAAAIVVAYFWPRSSPLERYVVGCAALLALPIAYHANASLRTRAIDHHAVILDARGSLDQATYRADNRHFCDLPEMRESLHNNADLTHWRDYLHAIGEYPYLKHLTDDLKQDPSYIAAAEGKLDLRCGAHSGGSARTRLARLFGLVRDPRPMELQKPRVEVTAGRYRLLPQADGRPLIVSARFTPPRCGHPQTIASDWTVASSCHAMYLAVRPDGTLRLGDGHDAIVTRTPVRWNEENCLQIEYHAQRRLVFLNGKLVVEDPTIPPFNPDRPFVVGDQGELEAEPFCGPLLVQIQGAEVEVWR